MPYNFNYSEEDSCTPLLLLASPCCCWRLANNQLIII